MSVAAERKFIFGKPVERVDEPEELLWLVAQFLDTPDSEQGSKRRNLRVRILKALDGGNWKARLTDEDDARYA